MVVGGGGCGDGGVVVVFGDGGEDGFGSCN